MAAPVWVLSVDLQTKTASFTTGLADAAKNARSAFSDIKGGASEMGGHISSNMFASRHAVMAVSEAFGTTMPRAITALLVHIGPLGAALEAAFPFAAIGLGAVLLIEHLAKLKEEGIKLTEDQVKFGTAAQNAFNKLDEKLLEAGIRSDELRNDHLGALHKKLELIDKQSMAELVHSFEEVAKAADVVFGDLKGHWYSMGIGSDGAKHALEDFQTHYSSLLSMGKDKEASDLLKGTRESAERILALQNQAKSSAGYANKAAGVTVDNAQLLAHEAALNELKRAGVGYTEKEVTSQQVLVQALTDQGTIEQKIAALKKLDEGNAKTGTGKELAGLAAEGARQAAEHKQKMGEIALGAQREQAAAELAMQQATIAQRLASDVALADKELAIQLQGNHDLIAALDKGGKDYNNQLHSLQEKAEEITAEHTAKVADLQSKANEEQYRKTLTDLEQSEREQIDATERGSAARLAAIDAAIHAQQARQLQNTAFYRELQTQQVETIRESTQEAEKLASEAGREEADNTQKMGELALAAEREKQAIMDSLHRVRIQQRIAEEVDAANQEFALKQEAMEREIAALDKHAKDYEVKLKAAQDREKQLVKQHENEVTAIRDSAEIERNQRILSAEDRLRDSIATGLTSVLMGHQTFAAMMRGLGQQVTSSLIENALKSKQANESTRQSDAAAAARKAYLTGESIPVIGPVMGPLFGAAAYSGMMAFAGGTDSVPGIGRGDIVPAMLTPGEGVVPNGVMDGLRKVASSGGFERGTTMNVHPTFAPKIHALDADGVDAVLTKHAKTFQKHFESTLRKMNK